MGSGTKASSFIVTVGVIAGKMSVAGVLATGASALPPHETIKIDAIKFEKDIKDRRVKHVYLSNRGLKIFDELFSVQ